MYHRSLLSIAFASALFSACLNSPEEPMFAMCEDNNDCGSGKICDVGVCWGDPPDSSNYAALLIPSAERSDLAPTEIPSIDIAQDGTISGLSFARSITVKGRIQSSCEAQEDCASIAIPAQITVERASSVPGLPTYRRSLRTQIEVGENDAHFQLSLPQDGLDYRVTVVADDSDVDGIPAELEELSFPPFSTTILADQDHEVIWELGDYSERIFAKGCIASTTGNGRNFAGMRVTAFGRWESEKTLSQASEVAVVGNDGCFKLSVPQDMQSEFDIVAKPGPGMVLPTLRLGGERILPPKDPKEYHQLGTLTMPNAANPIPFQIPVEGLSSGGGSQALGGVTLQFTTTFEEVPANQGRNILVSYTQQAVTGAQEGADAGIASVSLYPGSLDSNRSYKLRAFSPPDSEYASQFDLEVSVGGGDANDVLAAIQLPRRIALRGQIFSDDGLPLANTPIRLRPSPTLRRGLSSPEQTILDNLQFPSTLTGETGEFLVWVDPNLLGKESAYNLLIEPAGFSSAPPWSFEEISVAEMSGDSKDLGQLHLPQASYLRGYIADQEGNSVPGAELRWFQKSPDCAEFRDECEFESRRVGIWEADLDGQITIVLPDP